ncbi:MAG: hypothetical protein CL996_06170 [Euryarchaeota archaeon]|nr:hypothetical protein [Euryarchaeota archaeon]
MWKPVAIYSAFFALFFVTHIIAAANDMNLLFQLVAGLITVQTMLVGFCLHFLGGDPRTARVPSLGLSAGLGWAYAGMSLDYTIILWVISALVIQYGTEKGLKYGELAQ